MCRLACEKDQEETPCGDCDWRWPDLDTENELAWLIYLRVRECRTGGDNDRLDYSILFRLMDMEGFENDLQVEIYDKVYAVEADFLRLMIQQQKEAMKNGRPAS